MKELTRTIPIDIDYGLEKEDANQGDIPLLPNLSRISWISFMFYKVSVIVIIMTQFNTLLVILIS